MQIEIITNENSKSEVVEESESDLYKKVGEQLLNITIPNQLTIKTPYGQVTFEIKKRGSYVKNGIECDSMFVVEQSNSIQIPNSEYKEVYLTCVNPESNNYKFYHMTPKSDGIHVTYGRIGGNGGIFSERTISTPYPLHLYWIRYFEKLSKGYQDKSEIFLGDRVAHNEEENQSDSIASKLYRQLLNYANKVVRANLISTTVTKKQIETCKTLFNELGQSTDLAQFNDRLLELLAIAPRNVRDVKSLLAKSNNDFKRIMDREENLLMAMNALTAKSNGNNSFEDLGIEIYLATEKQEEQVLSHLSDNLKSKVKTIYRVINKKHQSRFNEYLKEENIQTVKQLWHGSRNENWLSIMTQGLQLNPNAQITGKMFGQGIYFAPSSEKSWNYTSYRGSYWASGRSDRGFMGLYATAYGSPHNVSTSASYTQTVLKNMGKNCVHARRGNALVNDEIIYYHENAMVLNYIVEFE